MRHHRDRISTFPGPNSTYFQPQVVPFAENVHIFSTFNSVDVIHEESK